jgi:protein-S-isoprenylcysteine O-methyltransferase Ste14
MFPILLIMYGRLAITEEAEMSKQFGTVYDSYAQQTPRFIPKFGHKTTLP